LTPPADGKAYVVLSRTYNEIHRANVPIVVLMAGLSILAPLAKAQRCGDRAANLAIDQASIDSSDLSSDQVNGSAPGQKSMATLSSTGNPSTPPLVVSRRRSRPDFNETIFFRHKLEFSLDVGWLPINVPFPFDVFEGDPYDLYPLRYTLVPVLASVRWQLGGIWGPPVLRGNWDLTFTASATAIPRGPETRYFSYDMGLRRNFIPRNWRAVPYWDVRAGMGFINAKGPLGVYYAQGQNFTFNINMGAGMRYQINPRYAISAGLNWMHLSNGNLSSPQYSNYGINVYGPMVGIDIELPRSRRHADQIAGRQ
jgi:Lipid A 3-O-deacylase (PagL)